MFIPKLSDRFDIKMGEVTVTVAPLSGRDKIVLSSFTSYELGKLKMDKPSQEHFTIKKSVKAVSGLNLIDGSPYVLEFEKGQDCLTDYCADELLGFLASSWFTVSMMQLSGGELGDVINPMTNKPLNGVSIEVKKEVKKEICEDPKELDETEKK